MSELHIRQIKAAIQKRLVPLVDVSDIAKKSAEEIALAGLSRGQAALALTCLSSVSDGEAAAAICDGYGDNGIDAALFHPSDRTIYLVQSKWRNNGKGSVDRGDLLKFLRGFRAFLNAQWSGFGADARAKLEPLEAHLNDANTRIVLVVVYTGTQPLSSELQSDIDDVLSEINDPVDIVSTQVLSQSDLYLAVSEGLAGKPVDVELALYDWGQVRDPYRGFYGQVAGSDVAAWKVNYPLRLFAPNLRVFLGPTAVNQDMVETLIQSPEKFWYFNNGITALCKSIAKKPIGGNAKDSGYFECRDLTIVNGAQTVGAIAAASAKAPDAISKARVAIRIISLEDCPPGFDKDVTRYTNTQNRIESRDFVALDPNQERIQAELRGEEIQYVFKSGEIPSSKEAGFDFVEAAVARACLQDVSMAVLAKGRIGKLWEDIEGNPYRRLFNGGVEGPQLWRLVQAMRIVESTLQETKAALSGRKQLLATHGNRFLIHVVFKELGSDFLVRREELSTEDVKRVQDQTLSAFERAHQAAEKHFSDNYLGSLFKNASKCQKLAESV